MGELYVEWRPASGEGLNQPGGWFDWDRPFDAWLAGQSKQQSDHLRALIGGGPVGAGPLERELLALMLIDGDWPPECERLLTILFCRPDGAWLAAGCDDPPQDDGTGPLPFERAQMAVLPAWDTLARPRQEREWLILEFFRLTLAPDRQKTAAVLVELLRRAA